MTIWKYKLDVAEHQNIKMLQGAQILSVQTQEDIPYLWVKVNTTAKLANRRISLVGTGYTFDFDLPYVGTFQQLGGMLVFHVFDGGEQA